MANMAKQAKAVLQTETIEAAADRGYFSAALHAVGADGTLGDVSTISEEAAARPPAVTACDGSRTGCRRVRFRVVAPVLARKPCAVAAQTAPWCMVERSVDGAATNCNAALHVPGRISDCSI
jgi:hypothetical protein